MNYFNKIPTIIYNGQVAKNLLARAKLSDQTKSNRTSFYPYTMSDDDRIDTLSNHYYDNPGYTWLIWMANNSIDPYYSMSLSDDDFNKFMIDKYGSVEMAMRKIAFYRTKLNSETRITTSAYGALIPRFKKYYRPILDINGMIASYERNPDLDVTNTNMIVMLTLSTVNQNLTVGEEVQVNGTNYAFVTNVDGNIATCQHVNGSFTAGDTITGQESGATATVSTVTTLVETIAYSDADYWQAVTFFDFENELNESKKEIQLLDVRFKGQAESELKRLMSIS